VRAFSRRPRAATNHRHGREKSFFRLLGPGLVTGASDDDPSGIATYSQVGAQFGYRLLWTMLFSYPLMSVVQEVSARIGRVTGCGIAGNMARHYPAGLTYTIVAAMVVANVINVGADLAGMAAAFSLLVGGPALAYAIVFALLSLLLETYISYPRYASILKWMTLTLLAYVATAFVVHVPWKAALVATVMPSLSVSGSMWTALIAVLGTTISPYLFFWQAAQETEELRTNHREKPLKRAPSQADEELFRIRIDTYVGMGVSNVVAYFIILTCAVSLHAHGITRIDSAAQAAEALRPLAGRFAALLFAAGIVGTGLLAIPVLAGSAAYAVAEALRLPIGLDRKPEDAKGFYAVLAAATLLGLALDFTSIDPISALFWSAVINGVVAVPVMVILMTMARNRKVMGRFVLSPMLTTIGWVATAVMLAAAIGLFATFGT
jgi:NRAMP (natural resistance-associated macrophage protein)-like metal ion transporter